MTDEMHEEKIKALLETLSDHKRFTVTAHSRPDGDAIGSSLALGEILDQLGHDVDIVMADPIPDMYATLPNVSSGTWRTPMRSRNWDRM